MNIAVLCFPGTNRAEDFAKALAYVTGYRVHRVWYTDRILPHRLDLVVLPGGFSHDDKAHPGVLAAQAPVMEAVRLHAHQGRLILGICNGFQVLCASGFLPGRLERNNHGRFVSRLHPVRIEGLATDFTACYGQNLVRLWPIAHGYGNYQCDGVTLEKLKESQCIALRYCSPLGDVTPSSNPNGSLENIAGLYNVSRRILGIMPHPENAVDSLISLPDGRRLFLSLLNSIGSF
jgi:phosphoribosylformylglycinamidine synthase